MSSCALAHCRATSFCRELAYGNSPNGRFCCKSLEEVPKPRRSDYASNMIPHSAPSGNGIPRIAPIGTRILSANAALDVRQATDRILQQNRHIPTRTSHGRSAPLQLLTSLSRAGPVTLRRMRLMFKVATQVTEASPFFLRRAPFRQPLLLPAPEPADPSTLVPHPALKPGVA